MLNPVKAEQYLSELELIRGSGSALTPRIIALSKLFDRLVKSITSDEKVAFRNFYARFRYLLATLPMRDVEQRNLENFRRLVKDGDQERANEKALEQGILLLKNLLTLSSGAPAIKDKAFREGYFTRMYPKRNYAKLTDLKVLCSSWTPLQEKEGKVFFILTAYDLEDLGQQVKVHIRKEDYYDYTLARKWLKEDAVLQMQHLRSLGTVEGANEMNGPDDTGVDEYETTFDTLI